MLSTWVHSITLDAIFLNALKGVALLAAVWMLTVALRKAPAAWRHALWLVGLVAVMAMPVASMFAPTVEVPIAWTSEQAMVSAPALLETPRPTLQHVDHVPLGGSLNAAVRSYSSTGDGEPYPDPASLISAAVARDIQFTDAAVGSAATAPIDWRMIAAGAWLLATLGLIAPYLFGRALLWRLRHWSRPLNDEAWQRALRDASEQLGIRRRVRLLISPRAIVPMTWGVLRPVVLLPHAAQSWDEARRRMVIGHELAHVRRYDCLSDAFARIVRALHWYNPLVWLALRRLCAEREAACDAWVLRLGHTPSAYAATLVDIARDTRHPRLLQAAGLAMARSSKVARRVKQILQPMAATHGYVRLSMVAVLAFLVVFGTLAALRVSSAQPGAAPQPRGVFAMPQAGSAQFGGMQSTPSPGLEVRIAPGDDAKAFPRLTLNNLPYDALRESGVDATTFHVNEGAVYGLEVKSPDDFARLVQAAAELVEMVTLIVGAADTPMGALVQVMDALKAAGIEKVQVRGESMPSGGFPPGVSGGFGGGYGAGGGGGFGMSGPGGGFGGGGGMAPRGQASSRRGRGAQDSQQEWPDRLMEMGKESVDVVGDAVAELLNNTRPEARHRAHVQNMLKQMGLVFKMYANESAGMRFPSLSESPAVLQPRIEQIYPEYLVDEEVRDFVSNKTEDVVVYTGYAMQDEADGLAFLDAYRNGTLGEDLEVGPDRRLFVLREGVERFYIQDINDPAAGGKEQSEIPVMWTMPGTTGGGNVLFMDGHVEHIEYPGKFPMTVDFIEGLRGAMKASHAAHHSPTLYELLQDVHDLEFHQSDYMGNTLIHARFEITEDDLAALESRIKSKPGFTDAPNVDHAFGPASAKSVTDTGEMIEIPWWTPQDCDSDTHYFWSLHAKLAPPQAHWLRVCPPENGEHRVYWRFESA